MRNKVNAAFVIAIMLTSFYCATGQSLTLKKLIDATSCSADACFTSRLLADSLCFKRTFTDATGTYFRYENCKENIAPDSRLVVHFAILNDKHLNSSFLTWSQEYNNKLSEELKLYKFEKMENPGDPDKKRTWYHSPDYPNLNIMWEELVDDKEVKRWHIGLVWE